MSSLTTYLLIQSFSAEIFVITGNFSLFNSQYFNYNLTRRFDFLPKSSSGVNWGRTLRGDIIAQNKQQGTLTVYYILEGDLHAAWTASILEL